MNILYLQTVNDLGLLKQKRRALTWGKVVVSTAARNLWQAPVITGHRRLQQGHLNMGAALRACTAAQVFNDLGLTGQLLHTAAASTPVNWISLNMPQKFRAYKNLKTQTPYGSLDSFFFFFLSPSSAVNFDPGPRYRLFTVFGIHI